MKKIPLSAFLPDELPEVMGVKQKFRGNQVFQWIHSPVFSFEEMSNLPKSLRRDLDDRFTVISSVPDQTFEDGDGTVKFRIKMEDGALVEAVLLTDNTGRQSLCISCQAGCRMGCAFCRTGQMGFKRHLEAREIVEQFLLAKKAGGEISNIVFMGMGEPLDNLGNIRRAVEILTHPGGTGLGMRKITLSTCGLTDGLRELADQGPGVKLAVSLITADPVLRKQLMPSAHKNSLEDIRKALLYYQEKRGKRFTLEVVLLDGVNCDQKEINRLSRFTSSLKAVVNVIPWNPSPGLDFKRPSGENVRRFITSLEEAGVQVTQRFRRGNGINAACGQLCPDEISD